MKKYLFLWLLLGSIQCRNKLQEVEKPFCDCQNFVETGTKVGMIRGLLNFPQCSTCPYVLTNRGIERPTFDAICPDSTFMAQLNSKNITDSTMVETEAIVLGYAGSTTRVPCMFKLGDIQSIAYPFHVKSIKKL
ncbi:hypothetical protein [Fibrella aquatilis]|uniref:Uncharacterized protein n=1 Tax=Fibrella aquatilis TaxID=2817059 RepID=A0A939JYN3_9BACT|nr:hypothetical protein [Fibrella aquatilis]MBO0934177.1 hypothetical protein [Fibrella aquatilis]